CSSALCARVSPECVWTRPDPHRVPSSQACSRLRSWLWASRLFRIGAGGGLGIAQIPSLAATARPLFGFLDSRSSVFPYPPARFVAEGPDGLPGPFAPEGV